MTRTIARGRFALLAVLLAAAAATMRPAAAFPPESPPDLDGGPTNFVTVSDGTSIALNVVVPDKCNPAATPESTVSCPAILEMAGYENGSSDKSGRTTIGQAQDWCRAQVSPSCPGLPLTGDSHEGTSAYRYDEDYVLVHASVRGSGCSSGEFDLFSERSAMDGYEIIESWIADEVRREQLAADHPELNLVRFRHNGKVGIIGHSYSGITGFFVAAQEGLAKREGRKSSLTAVTVSGLIDDLYRGIVYPGGVSNVLFPPLWTLGIRPAYDVLGGQLQGIVRNADDNNDIAVQCARNMAAHGREIFEDPVLNGIGDTDSNWWRSRSLVSVATNIAAPIHMAGAFQDEQTGPRFPHLFEVVPDATPKRLLMSNGDHGTQVSSPLWQDRKAWMDYWMRGVGGPYPVHSVRTLVQLRSNGSFYGEKVSTSFPLDDTAWTPYFLCGNQALVTGGCASPDYASYVSGSKRQSWSYQAGEGVGSPHTTRRAPDELDFLSAPFQTDTLINGPIVVNLFAASTATDTEFFVQVADRTPDGTVAILQRGMLKASHRAVDHLRSDYDGGTLYRPFHPHTNPTDIEPGAINEYLIEVFPVAWPFRAGHRLQVKIMAPPAVDSYYAYAPKTLPAALNTVYFGGDYPSRITVPVVGWVPLTGDPACSLVYRIRCVRDE